MRPRELAVPLAVYVAITLVLPAANGAAGRADFWRHAAWVLAGCAVMVAFAAAIEAVRNSRRVRRVTSGGDRR